MTFDIPLAEQRVKPHQVTALHLLSGFAMLAFGAILLLLNNIVVPVPDANIPASEKGIDMTDVAASFVMLSSMVIVISSLFRNKWLLKANNNKAFRIIELLLSAAIAIYLLSVQFYTLAAIFGLLVATIIFAFTQENSKSGNIPHVIINDEGIKPPFALKRRFINWGEVEKVLLRHGNLTINCNDNRLYQWTTQQHDTDTETFEAFCNAQIAAARKKGNNNW